MYNLPEDIIEALSVVAEIKYGIEDIIAGTLPEVDENDTHRAKMLGVLLDWFKTQETDLKLQTCHHCGTKTPLSMCIDMWCLDDEKNTYCYPCQKILKIGWFGKK